VELAAACAEALELAATSAKAVEAVELTSASILLRQWR
jgi:hypothetical protein